MDTEELKEASKNKENFLKQLLTLSSRVDRVSFLKFLWSEVIEKDFPKNVDEASSLLQVSGEEIETFMEDHLSKYLVSFSDVFAESVLARASLKLMSRLRANRPVSGDKFGLNGFIEQASTNLAADTFDLLNGKLKRNISDPQIQAFSLIKQQFSSQSSSDLTSQQSVSNNSLLDEISAANFSGKTPQKNEEEVLEDEALEDSGADEEIYDQQEDFISQEIARLSLQSSNVLQGKKPQVVKRKDLPHIQKIQQQQNLEERCVSLERQLAAALERERSNNKEDLRSSFSSPSRSPAKSRFYSDSFSASKSLLSSPISLLSSSTDMYDLERREDREAEMVASLSKQSRSELVHPVVARDFLSSVRFDLDDALNNKEERCTFFNDYYNNKMKRINVDQLQRKSLHLSCFLLAQILDAHVSEYRFEGDDPLSSETFTTTISAFASLCSALIDNNYGVYNLFLVDAGDDNILSPEVHRLMQNIAKKASSTDLNSSVSSRASPYSSNSQQQQQNKKRSNVRLTSDRNNNPQRNNNNSQRNNNNRQQQNSSSQQQNNNNYQQQNNNNYQQQNKNNYQQQNDNQQQRSRSGPRNDSSWRNRSPAPSRPEGGRQQ